MHKPARRGAFRRAAAALLAIVLPLCLFACSRPGRIADEISDALEIDLRAGRTVAVSQDRDRMFGDGQLFVELQFYGDDAEAAIRDNPRWNPLPPNDEVTTLLYGSSGINSFAGPFVTTRDGEPLFPAVKTGYYFFEDRHPDAWAGEPESAVLERASFNFTVAVYDAESDTLYFAQLDT